MARNEKVLRLMDELGPSTEEISHVTQVTDDSWAVGYLGNNVMLLQLDDGGQQLVLSSSVGRARPEQRDQVNEVLLAYNALWRDTGGITMAVVKEAVLQLHALEAESLDLPTLRSVLQNFAEKATIWRAALEAGAISAPVLQAPTGIRV